MSSDTSAPVISAELFTIPLEDNRYILYAPLRRAAFVANARVVNFLADLKTGAFDQAVDSDGSLVEFLRRLEILDAGPEQLPVTEFSGDPEPIAVTLFLTTACNLRCTYCYASAGDTPTKYMPLEVAKRGIDFVAGNAVKRQAPYFEIAYHSGGEPSVNWRVMTESLHYAKQKAAELGLEVRAGSATNGVMNDADRLGDRQSQQRQRLFRRPAVGARSPSPDRAGTRLQPSGDAHAAPLRRGELSLRPAKEAFQTADPLSILQRLSELSIPTWNYKWDDPAIRHIGPMAQDFAAAFGVGEDDKHIYPVDAQGVAFAAIQGLYRIAQEKEVQLENQQRITESLREQLRLQQEENKEMKARIEALERLMKPQA